MDSFLRASHSHTRREGRENPGSFIVVQPKFPIHYVDTLAPAAAFAPRHASRLCNYAFRRSRCSALPAHLLALAVTSIDSTLPIFGLGIIRARNGRSSWVRIITGLASRGAADECAVRPSAQ